MQNFFYEKKHVVVLILLLFISFTLITLSISGSRDKLEKIEKTILYLVGPILKVSTVPKERGQKIWNKYLDLQDRKKENVKISKELLELRDIQKSFWELKSEIARLHQLLNIKKRKKYNYHFGKVINQEQNVLLKTVTIDKGSTDKIKKSMIVVNSQGLVGRIHYSNLFTSRVLLLTDPRSPVHVRVQRTRAQGIFSMISVEKGIVKFMSKSSDILPGDLLISTGHGGVFPQGIRVAYVLRVKKDSLFKKIEAKPSVDFTKLEELAIMEEKKRN